MKLKGSTIFVFGWMFVIFLIFLAGYSVWNGQPKMALRLLTVIVLCLLPLPFLCFFLVAVGISVRDRFTRRRDIGFFRHPTPDRAIAFFHRPRRAPNSGASAAYRSAVAAVLYGQFDRARLEMAPIDWNSLPFLFQAYAAYVNSLLALFEDKDYRRALAVAQQAYDVCRVHADSHKPPMAAVDVHLLACKLLAAESTPSLDEFGQRIETLSKKVSPAVPVWTLAIPSWAMAVCQKKLGHDVAAAEYIAVVKRYFPHSPVLSDLTGL